MKTKENVNQFADYATAVIRALPQFLAPGKMAKYANNHRHLKAILNKALNSELLFKENIDYDIPFGEMIKLGNYAKVEDGIDEINYPHIQNGKNEIIFEAVGFPKEKAIETTKVLSYFQKRKIRPANAYELLFFGVSHPDLQKEYMIHSLALGNKLLTPRNALSLSYSEKKRILIRAFSQNCYSTKSRFLAVHLS